MSSPSADDEPAVWRDLASLAAATFPGLPLVGYEFGDELKAAHEAGFEIGDPLRVWVVARQLGTCSRTPSAP